MERVQPELIAVTGDLTHRGRRREHERAAAFLRGLGRPLLVIPGNHDIPYTFPARFTRPWAEFERQWETVEPVFRSDELLVVGLNSVRPWRHQSGGIRRAQIARAAELLADAPEGALRVVALHHHLIGAPWRSRKRPVARRSEVLAGPRRRGRGADPRRPHPPGRGQRAARVRGRAQRPARRDGLDRAGPRAAAAEPARRGARPARLRGERPTRCSSRPTSGAKTTGASPRCGASRAAEAPLSSEPG